MKVLVAEDNAESRYLLVKILQAYGHEVTATANGAEALQQALKEPPDILVTDILMPRMDGYQLCHEWRQNDRLKDIPFIFYTATYKDERDEELALKLGADKFLIKPIEPEEFIQIIQGIFRDLDKGKVGQKKPVVEEEKEVLKLYSERLITKLEKKMLDLEAEITERKQAEERIEHLNRVLHAIRSVNQLIVKEKDRQRLLKGICNNLTKTGGYYNAWIAILDESGRLVTYAEAGLGEDFLPMVEQLKHGELVTCARQALGQAGVVVIKDPLLTCSDCPLAKKYRGRAAMTIRLEHNEKVYGLLVTSIPTGFVEEKEEQSVFQEVAKDIAFALHGLELEEKHKQAEEALRESEEKYRTLTENVNVGIYRNTPGPKAKFIEVNPALVKMFGYRSRKELLSINVADLYQNPRDRKNFNEKMVREGYVRGEELQLKKKDGTSLIASVSAVAAKDEKGRVQYYDGIIEDITERRRAEEKAREVEALTELDRLRSGLLANMSHELRTPLTSIKGFATTLLRPDVSWSEEEQQDFLQAIDQETDRLTRLISDLLDMSRLEAGGLKLEKRNYQVSEIPDSVSNRLASLTEHHQLQVIAPVELPPVFVDQMRLGQVLTNLVENAIKFSPEGSQITVEAQLAGDQVIVSVADRGQGIPTELLDKVFDRFYQTESIVTGRKSGTGLGLSICQGIIEAHSGKIWLESKLGEGSKFSFSLPVGKGQEEIAEDSGH